MDEAQFLTPAQVWQLARAVDDLDVPVMAYGLRVDFRGELFPGSATLLALADEMREVRTICHCGRKATMVVRRDAPGRGPAARARRSRSAATSATRASAAATGARPWATASPVLAQRPGVRGRAPGLSPDAFGGSRPSAKATRLSIAIRPIASRTRQRRRPEVRQQHAFSSARSRSGTSGSRA